MESLLLLVIDGAPTPESVGIARRGGVAKFVVLDSGFEEGEELASPELVHQTEYRDLACNYYMVYHYKKLVAINPQTQDPPTEGASTNTLDQSNCRPTVAHRNFRTRFSADTHPKGAISQLSVPSWNSQLFSGLCVAPPSEPKLEVWAQSPPCYAFVHTTSPTSDLAFPLSEFDQHIIEYRPVTSQKWVLAVSLGLLQQ